MDERKKSVDKTCAFVVFYSHQNATSAKFFGADFPHSPSKISIFCKEADLWTSHGSSIMKQVFPRL